MNFLRIKYFLEVGRTLNFTHAARNLHVSQSSLSRQIQLLEEEVGAPLLERDNRNVKLTDLGSKFINEISVPLSNLEDAYKRVIDSVNPVKNIRVGIYQPVNISTFSDFLDQLQHYFQDYAIQLIRCKAPELRERYLAREIDIILTTYVLGLDLPDAEEYVIGTEPAGIIFGKHFSDAPISFDSVFELNGKEMILLSDDIAPGCQEVYMSMLADIGVKPGKTVVVSDLSWKLCSDSEPCFSIIAPNSTPFDRTLQVMFIPEEKCRFKKTVIWNRSSHINMKDMLNTAEQEG